MLDPRYKEIKQEVQARSQNVTMVGGDSVAQNLANFAKRRPDLFGSVDDQLPEEDRPYRSQEQSKVIWDGQAANMNRTTANQAMLAQQQKRNMEEQMKNVSDTVKKELGPAISSQMPKPLIATPQVLLPPSQMIGTPIIPGGIGGIPRLTPQDLLPPPSFGVSQALHMGPQNLANPLEGTKKIKTEESNLIPEEIWLKNNAGPITLNIKVPSTEVEEGWNLKGQLIQVQFDPIKSIGDLKEYIANLLGGNRNY